MMFLSADELFELTCYHRNADQRRWLTARGWRFEQTANGRPIVARKHAEAMLCGEEAKREWEAQRVNVLQRKL